jgi:Ca2+-transporting ATPase
MELALLRAGFRAGITRSALLQHSPIAHKHSFDAASKMMATVHRRGDKFLFAIKGAPEAVLAASENILAEYGKVRLDAEARTKWHAHIEYFGHHGLRVLACAMKTDTQADAPPYERLTFVGLSGLEDPGARRCTTRDQRLPGRWHSRRHGDRRSRRDRAQHRTRGRTRPYRRSCGRRQAS